MPVPRISEAGHSSTFNIFPWAARPIPASEDVSISSSLIFVPKMSPTIPAAQVIPQEEFYGSQ